MGGCSRDEVSIRRDPTSGDFGHSALLTAADKFAKTSQSPADYRELAVEIERLRPQFSRDVELLAEQNLVFLVLEPLSSVLDKSYQEQLDALALTVWPTALEVEPRAGESPTQFLERVCSTELARACQLVVPEYWPLVIGGMVWKRFKERARAALAACVECPGRATYQAAIEKFEAEDERLTTATGVLKDEVKPKAWPVVGQRSEAWSATTLLERRLDGKIWIDGIEVEQSRCRTVLENKRRDSSLLGVHLHPRDKVAVIQAMADDAAGAGYTEIAVQVRRPEYPYELRQYRLQIGKQATGKKLEVRGVDTIQVMIQMLDAMCDGYQGPFRL